MPQPFYNWDMSDLFSNAAAAPTPSAEEYTAQDIEVLEGLEPVRRRPGMYIGGTDENALHHLVSEVFDNAMDEAVAGFATRIELEMHADGSITIRDNGRGIPIDKHPKFPKKSALEVIFTTLHSGGKFSDKVYSTAGGLHGVGISVVNALSENLTVEVVRDKTLWRQTYSRGEPTSKLEKIGSINNRRGSSITFSHDPDIFGTRLYFRPRRLYQLAKSKAYLFRGVEIRWICDPVLLTGRDEIPEKDTIHFPNGLCDYLTATLGNAETATEEPFAGTAKLPDKLGSVEWAIAWSPEQDSFAHSYCNTVPTPNGGTHEAGFKAALLKGLRAYGEMTGNKKAAQITGDDVLSNTCIILSLFIKDPQFQGQTKEKLASSRATKLVENAIRDPFDHWLSGNTQAANTLLSYIIQCTEERLSRKAKKEINRKSFTKSLRLPGKLTDCTREMPEGTEIFLVEGDSAGGSAKQARNRETQAILPLRGKILNVASATSEKINANQETSDIALALGCGMGTTYNEDMLRYEKVIIMTDADVDGSHIAALLMTFFYCQMQDLIRNGHLYIAQPPLFRLTQNNKTYYAQDDKEKEKLAQKLSQKRGNIDIGRFKGLGEMVASQLKETTMNPANRILLKVVIDHESEDDAKNKIHDLMGKKPELRFKFIQEQTQMHSETLSDSLDI